MTGLSSRATRLQFVVPVYHGIAIHTCTSSDRERVESGLKESFGKSVARSAVYKTIDGDVIRGDDLEVKPTIVKIDAEGVEYEILLGLTETIERSRPFMVVEISNHQDEVLSYLAARDYAILGYDSFNDRFSSQPEHYTFAEPGHRNSFAVPREKLALLPYD